MPLGDHLLDVSSAPHRGVLCWWRSMASSRPLSFLSLPCAFRVFASLSRAEASQAKIVEHLLGDLHRVVSGVQVGITLTSLAIGALGELTLATFVQSVMPVQGSPRTLLLDSRRCPHDLFPFPQRHPRCLRRISPQDHQPRPCRTRRPDVVSPVPVVSEHFSLGHRFPRRRLRRSS